MAVAGVYMFRDPDLVEKAFKTLKPSWRGEYEVTELIQWFIDNGYVVEYDIITGWWKDVGTYEGLLEALYLLLDDASERVEGEIRGEVIGRVIVERGALVEGKVYGPAYVGEDVVVGKNAMVEHFVSIEKGAKVLSGFITRSLILDESVVDIEALRLIDSVIGAKSTIKARRDVHGEARFIISDYSIIEF